MTYHFVWRLCSAVTDLAYLGLFNSTYFQNGAESQVGTATKWKTPFSCCHCHHHGQPLLLPLYPLAFHPEKKTAGSNLEGFIALLCVSDTCVSSISGMMSSLDVSLLEESD